MKKKILVLLLLVAALFTLTACESKKEEKKNKKDNSMAIAFKKDYESLNGKKNSKGVEYRQVTINEENPFEIVKASDIVKKIENKETFYIYFGDKMCPWCRSVIEKAIEVANAKKIDKIYYVEIWDDTGAEILRDKYVVKKGKAKKSVEGTKEYKELLKFFDSLLDDYTLTTKTKKGKTKKIKTGEKRIFAPNFIYVENGKAIKLVDGISVKQKETNEKLTEDMLKDEEKNFTEFFTK